MKHPFGVNILSQYIDKRSAKKEAERIETHVALCQSCKRDLVILENLVKALNSVKDVGPAPNFDFRFNKRLDEAIKKRKEEKIYESIARRALESFDRIQIKPAPVLLKTVAALVIVFAVSVACFGQFSVVSPEVISAEGKVALFDKSQGKWVDAKLASRIDKGDIIKTYSSGEIDVGASKIYAMRIKENSEVEAISLTRRGIKGRVFFNLKSGRMLVDIGKKFKGSEFRVLTPAAEAKALGTKFMVDTSEDDSRKTWVGVAEGEVEVKSTSMPDIYAMAKEAVIVKAGQKTEIIPGMPPLMPQKLLDEEWRKIQELYQIGSKMQVVLLISMGDSRVREFLRPCPLYISQELPRTIPAILEDAVVIINEAIEKKDKQKHLEAANKLKEIVEKYPDPRYNAQFLMFIGAYYNDIGSYENAIDTLEKVIEQYPHSSLASLAQCAIGSIYEEGLNNKDKAIEAYQKVVQNYPNSPEVQIAKSALDIKKGR